jgi:hypothetical protein
VWPPAIVIEAIQMTAARRPTTLGCGYFLKRKYPVLVCQQEVAGSIRLAPLEKCLLIVVFWFAGSPDLSFGLTIGHRDWASNMVGRRRNQQNLSEHCVRALPVGLRSAAGGPTLLNVRSGPTDARVDGGSTPRTAIAIALCSAPRMGGARRKPKHIEVDPQEAAGPRTIRARRELRWRRSTPCLDVAGLEVGLGE